MFSAAILIGANLTRFDGRDKSARLTALHAAARHGEKDGVTLR